MLKDSNSNNQFWLLAKVRDKISLNLNIFVFKCSSILGILNSYFCVNIWGFVMFLSLYILCIVSDVKMRLNNNRFPFSLSAFMVSKQ